MLRVLKRQAVLLLVGALLGGVLTSLIAPNALTWLQTPGTGSALCNCTDLAKQTAHELVHVQLIGLVIGAVALAVLGEIVHHLWARRRAAKAAAAAPAPAPKG
jgi:hypothetical protein